MSILTTSVNKNVYTIINLRQGQEIAGCSADCEVCLDAPEVGAGRPARAESYEAYACSGISERVDEALQDSFHPSRMDVFLLSSSLGSDFFLG